ncbi:transcriptional regulator, DeoR family [Lacrimispora sphenoides]|uniref:DeoR/GlpR family DNA-binding transcription regulator n=1 Tax=Lacrimispora sphenoides TaxID=29370 RepID=UPI0008BAB5BA|nr:DeoR/GlpR family DNA-binding transcription regulator [Lacrimispora sphenoides]SEU25449.1 transcriptional regulator, DeoR family [Lacrimispora sphenoides]
MLSQQRLYHIMSIVKEQSFVTIKELMEQLNVSKSTVTRDLIELEEQGLVSRERGGAMCREVSSTLTVFNEVPTVNKESLCAEAKEIVCQRAVTNVKDGDCVYVDSGTTPVYLLPQLLAHHVKIVTPSIYLIKKIPITYKGDIYLLGGRFSPDYDLSTGSMAVDMIRNFNFDHSFFSTNGVNMESGEVYIFDMEIGTMKKEIMKKSQNNHLLIDDSKYHIKAMFSWASLEDFTNVYVNRLPDTGEAPDNFTVCLS